LSIAACMRSDFIVVVHSLLDAVRNIQESMGRHSNSTEHTFPVMGEHRTRYRRHKLEGAQMAGCILSGLYLSLLSPWPRP
jgi:hypothetical protein